MKYKIRENILWKIVDGEAVIVDPNKDDYCYLNQTGTEIWRLINDGKDKKTIVNELLEKYNSTKAILNRDYDALIKELIDKEIIEKGSE